MVPLRAFVVLVLAFPALLLADENRDAIVAATDRFELRSDPRVSLHHFLIAWAAADHDEWPPYALPIAERESWRAVLDDKEERAWTVAAEAYAASRGRSVVSCCKNSRPFRPVLAGFCHPNVSSQRGQ